MIKDDISWNEYFMGIALCASLKSNDPNTCVGACIVDQNNSIVSIGYNKLPIWFLNDNSLLEPLNSDGQDKYMYVNHAEMEAILNSKESKVFGSTLYVTLFPCNECAKLIVKLGVKKIIYYEDRNPHMDICIAAKNIFNSEGIEFVQYKTKSRKIEFTL